VRGPNQRSGAYDHRVATVSVSNVTYIARAEPVDCPFCHRIAAADFLSANEVAAAFPDAFPLSPGHMLIVPRRHEADFLALTPDEQAGIWTLVSSMTRHIETTQKPDGYNIGINVGVAAGQTVAHAHLHVIPRYQGDVADPRGGVRWVLPSKAPYWQRQ
jgi:diadenosine tetraphosphate (Ap4A) HIT family hydrolase